MSDVNKHRNINKAVATYVQSWILLQKQQLIPQQWYYYLRGGSTWSNPVFVWSPNYLFHPETTSESHRRHTNNLTEIHILRSFFTCNSSPQCPNYKWMDLKWPLNYYEEDWNFISANLSFWCCSALQSQGLCSNKVHSLVSWSVVSVNGSRLFWRLAHLIANEILKTMMSTLFG